MIELAVPGVLVLELALGCERGWKLCVNWTRSSDYYSPLRTGGGLRVGMNHRASLVTKIIRITFQTHDIDSKSCKGTSPHQKL